MVPDELGGALITYGNAAQTGLAAQRVDSARPGATRVLAAATCFEWSAIGSAYPSTEMSARWRRRHVLPVARRQREQQSASPRSLLELRDRGVPIGHRPDASHLRPVVRRHEPGRWLLERPGLHPSSAKAPGSICSSFFLPDGGPMIDAGPTEGVLVANTNTISFPTLIGDGAGGVILAWIDETSSSVAELFAQRFDPTGAPLWGAQPLLVSNAGSTPYNSGSSPPPFRLLATPDHNVALFWTAAPQGCFGGEARSLTGGARQWGRARPVERSSATHFSRLLAGCHLRHRQELSIACSKLPDLPDPSPSTCSPDGTSRRHDTGQRESIGGGRGRSTLELTPGQTPAQASMRALTRRPRRGRNAGRGQGQRTTADSGAPAPDGEYPHAASSGCGCGTNGGAPLWPLAVFLLAIGALRRRAHPQKS